MELEKWPGGNREDKGVVVEDDNPPVVATELFVPSVM